MGSEMCIRDRNRTRTIITTIGVFWGIFIYIALAGSATGLENGFDEAFSGLSKNSMGVWVQSTSVPYKGFEEGRRFPFRLSDVDYLRDRVPEIEYISPGHQLGAFSGSAPIVVRGTKTDNFNIFGNYPNYATITVKKLFDGGRWINDEDMRLERKVAIIEGALRVFNDLGIEKTTMDEIAQESGFGKATLYYYFTSKDDVFIHIMEHGWKQLWEGIETKVCLLYTSPSPRDS